MFCFPLSLHAPSPPFRVVFEVWCHRKGGQPGEGGGRGRIRGGGGPPLPVPAPRHGGWPLFCLVTQRAPPQVARARASTRDALCCHLSFRHAWCISFRQNCNGQTAAPLKRVGFSTARPLRLFVVSLDHCVGGGRALRKNADAWRGTSITSVTLGTVVLGGLRHGSDGRDRDVLLLRLHFLRLLNVHLGRLRLVCVQEKVSLGCAKKKYNSC